MSVPVIILASGYGQIRNGFPKVCEEIDGKAMIIKITKTALSISKDIIITVNPLFENVVCKTLVELPIDFVIQPNRHGSADAVEQALEKITSDSVLIIFGDMPFWKSQTLNKLIYAHQENKATITLVSIEITKKVPEIIERYGRILKNDKNQIIAIIEPGDINEDLAGQTKTVNPSLYCFKTDWLKRNIKNLPYRHKNDGYPPERTLPPLVVMATQQGEKVLEIPLENPLEALGINTEEELKFARNILNLL